MVSGKFSGNFGGKFSGNFDILINILYEKAFQPQYIVIRRLWQGRRDLNPRRRGRLLSRAAPAGRRPRARSAPPLPENLALLRFPGAL